MARGFNYHQPSILFHKEKGLGIKYATKSPLYDNIKEEIRIREEEENKRILYVAMTRAKERLIIGNQGKDRGFKKLIKDLIDDNQVVYIHKTNSQKEERERVKGIKEELYDKNPLVHENFLYGLKSQDMNKRFLIALMYLSIWNLGDAENYFT